MSYAMAIGMEVYNTAYNQGFHLGGGGLSSMTNAVFLPALMETAYMGLIVLLVSGLYGNRCGAAFARRHCAEGRDNPYFCRLLRQAGTVAVMCPGMSLAAAVLFSVALDGRSWTELPAIWIGTVLKNFPMAFFWNFFRRRALHSLAVWQDISRLGRGTGISLCGAAGFDSGKSADGPRKRRRRPRGASFFTWLRLILPQVRP